MMERVDDINGIELARQSDGTDLRTAPEGLYVAERTDTDVSLDASLDVSPAASSVATLTSSSPSTLALLPLTSLWTERSRHAYEIWLVSSYANGSHADGSYVDGAHVVENAYVTMAGQRLSLATGQAWLLAPSTDAGLICDTDSLPSVTGLRLIIPASLMAQLEAVIAARWQGLFVRKPYLGLVLEGPLFDQLTSLVSVLRLEQQQQSDWQVMRPVLGALLHCLLRQCNAMQLDPPAIADQRLARLHGLIDQHFSVEHSVEFYAQQLNITSRHLNKLAKSVLGKTVSSLIRERIIAEAKRKLRSSSGNIKKIAYDLGFENQSYFARYFRRATGISPNAFRRQGIY